MLDIERSYHTLLCQKGDEITISDDLVIRYLETIRDAREAGKMFEKAKCNHKNALKALRKMLQHNKSVRSKKLIKYLT